MPQVHPLSRQTRAAAALLGMQIASGRRERRWQLAELAERAGVSVPTARKAERGDPSVSLGTALELATLVGVRLFGVDDDEIGRQLNERRDRLALLPARIRRRPSDEVSNDF
jgi:transcriptional regulator with XRE-family HTH domain